MLQSDKFVRFLTEFFSKAFDVVNHNQVLLHKVS